jgi:outer membrane protein TolC
MKSIWKGRGVVLVLVAVLLAGITTVFAAEDTLMAALEDLYATMYGNRNTVTLNQLDIQLIENEIEDADQESAKIFNTGVYEQGYNNTVTRDVTPDEARSRLEQEKRAQAREPLVKEGALHKAIEALRLSRAQLQTETRLLALTKQEVAIAEARYTAGIISLADLEDARATVTAAELSLEKLALSVASAELEVNSLAGTDLDTLLQGGDEVVLMETRFGDMSALPEWEELAKAADPALFAKAEALRILDLKIAIAKNFIPDNHSRVIQLKRDREDARVALQDTTDGIVVNLRNTLNDRLTAAENLELALLDQDMAARRQTLAKARYDAGVANKLDLIAAEKAVVQAQQSVWSATVSLNRVETDLRVLTGLPVVTEAFATLPVPEVTTGAAVEAVEEPAGEATPAPVE